MNAGKILPIAVLVLSFSILPNFCLAKYSGGTGDPNNPYQIATKADLQALAANTGDYGKCFILTADINMGSQVFTTAIIAADNNSFTGTFDGNGHKITHFTINGGSNSDLGLFGYIDSGGNVKNLGLENFSVNGDSNSYDVGGLVGYNYEGSISNCYSTGTVSGHSDYYDVGGLVGKNEYGSISNCYSTGSVSGFDTVGGLVGANDYGPISNCYSTGTVSGGSDSYDVGGLVGWSYYGTISNCYSTGEVSGSQDVGGLAGENYNGNVSNCYSTGTVSGGSDSYDVGGLVGLSNYCTISNCYSTDTVSGGSGSNSVGGMLGHSDGNISNCYSTGSVSGGSGSDYVGGLAGYNEDSINNCYSTGTVSGGSDSYDVGGLVGDNDGPIADCYSTGAVSGSSYVGGLVGLNYNSSGSIVSSFWDINTSGQTTSAGGAGKTTAQMKTESTFTTAGWDFTNIWAICEGTNYPRLIWQIPAADLVCPDGVNFADFAYFADRWHTTGCNSSNNFCGGADMNHSGTVDMQDLEMFAEEWLSGK